MDASNERRRQENRNNAATFLAEVKDTFHDQRDKYVMFLSIMKELRNVRNDHSNVESVVARAKELFSGHNNLIIEFNAFLPADYKITVDDDEEEDSCISTARDY
ncbi:PREDICTED: paired amphipathic helix protein Sin3-like 2 [Camelina sativa]|uniref:Paired amphipathic helix protein Sin3-like 2 n=1 Tax=Camelina sativa TaxID=90675 RepID=A0ABM0T305_CAMSA|nr:PREDICTED: paired amphipathic helix protein Sin3-like 2 [Camelina sativa]